MSWSSVSSSVVRNRLRTPDERMTSYSWILARLKNRSIMSASLRVCTSVEITLPDELLAVLTVSLIATEPLESARLQTMSIALAPSILFCMKFYLRKRMPRRVSSWYLPISISVFGYLRFINLSQRFSTMSSMFGKRMGLRSSASAEASLVSATFFRRSMYRSTKDLWYMGTAFVIRLIMC